MADGLAAGMGQQLRIVRKQAVQRVSGSAAWATLPDMAEKRSGAVAVALPDGRLLVAGGLAGQTCHASVEVLAAACSGWVAVAAMSALLVFATAGLLPSGRVIVAGGRSATDNALALASVEQWDPVEDRWSVLPPMLHARTEAAGVLLADGRFAVMGVIGADGTVRRDREVFDPATGMWEPLPGMAASRASHAVAAVPGGMVAFGGDQ